MSISIRLLRENELEEANHLFRLAFGTFVGNPIPENYSSDLNYMNRWHADPQAAFAAESDGKLIGANIAINRGSFGLFGPLIVHPELWNRGVGKRLIEAAIDCFSKWNIEQAGLFTFSNSPKHLSLYQKFGFYPRFLTALMSKKLAGVRADNFKGSKYSALKEDDRTRCLKACRELTGEIYAGLDLSKEIQLVDLKKLGDTILLWEESNLEGFAICHCGENTEAGKDICQLRFAVVRSGRKAEEWFEKLIRECSDFAAVRGLSILACGVSTESDRAYQKILSLGFQIDRLGVAMHKPNQPAYYRSSIWAIGDWR